MYLHGGEVYKTIHQVDYSKAHHFNKSQNKFLHQRNLFYFSHSISIWKKCFCNFYFRNKVDFTSRIYLGNNLNFDYKEQLMEVFWPSIFQPWESRTKPWFLGGELKASRSKRSTTFLLIKQQSPKREGEWLNKFSIFWERRSTGLRTSTLQCWEFLPMVSLKSLFYKSDFSTKLF